METFSYSFHKNDTEHIHISYLILIGVARFTKGEKALTPIYYRLRLKAYRLKEKSFPKKDPKQTHDLHGL